MIACVRALGTAIALGAGLQLVPPPAHAASPEDAEAYEEYLREKIGPRTRGILREEESESPWGDSETQPPPEDPTLDPAERERLKELFQYAAEMRVDATGAEPLRDLAAAIDALAAEPALLQSHVAQAGGGDTACRIYSERMGPSGGCFWTDLASKLNSRNYRAAGLRQGEPVRYPVATVERRRFSRVVDPEWADEELGPSVGDVSRGRAEVDVKRMPNGLVRVSWTGYRLRVPLRDEGSAAEAEDRLNRLRIELSWSTSHAYREKDADAPSRPLILQQRPLYSKILKGAQTDPRDHAVVCRESVPRDGSEGAYVRLVSPDFGGVCNPHGLDPAEISTLEDEAALAKVVLIDTKVCAHADFGDAVEGAQDCGEVAAWSGKCDFVPDSEWRQEEHHATHLAGLIVSQPNGRGFVGLNPDARVLSYHHQATSGSEAQLADQLQAWLEDDDFWTVGEPPVRRLPIFVFASQFTELVPRTDDEGRVRDPEDRFETVPAKAIEFQRPLLIVAAGQSGDRSGSLTPLDIQVDTPHSPQHLGGLMNVLVVTGCTSCGAHQAKLDRRAHHSQRDRHSRLHLVHVAAPSMRVPSTIGATGYIDQGGSSHASAYTAGVAAAMVGCYPEHYTRAYHVKQRLQLTARPSFTERELERLATGVVDPFVATLDPTLDWFQARPDDDNAPKPHTYERVQIGGWCSERLQFRDPRNFDGTPPEFNFASADVVRVARYRAVDPGAEEQWIAYLRNSDGRVFHGRKAHHHKGDIIRVGPMSLAPNEAHVVIENTRVDLHDVEDLILHAPAEASDEACGS